MKLGHAILVAALTSLLLLLLIVGPEMKQIRDADKNKEIMEQQSDIEGVAPSQMVPYPESENKTTERFAINLEYQMYPMRDTYFLVLNTMLVYQEASESSTVMKRAKKNDFIDYIETISNGELWYHVSWKEDNEAHDGYIPARSPVEKRTLRLEKMFDRIKSVDVDGDKLPISYISNYHNTNGYAPLYHKKSKDRNGNNQSQSAPGYWDTTHLDEFDYLSDGSLVRIWSLDDQYTKVSLIGEKEVYYVPNRYVVTPAALTALSKAIVVDRTNQNEAAFEKQDGVWTVISWTYATTGTTGAYQQPTPLGYYFGIEKRERFYYYKDGTKSIQGYAPYAIRFTGGAYIHGIPVNYQFDGAGNRIDPGKIEYSKTIGTVPLSHKCVRNYTSHAKFLYDWFSYGETIVIVIE